jgi:hypothetical protein
LSRYPQLEPNSKSMMKTKVTNLTKPHRCPVMFVRLLSVISVLLVSAGCIGPGIDVDEWGRLKVTLLLPSKLCTSCGRFGDDKPISIGGTEGIEKLPDGRHICGKCKKTAINSEDDAKPVLHSVANVLSNKGIKINLNNIVLKIVDNEQSLIKLHGGNHEHLGGLSGFHRGLGLGVNGRRSRIYILGGYSKRVFEAILAHELMHAWIYQHTRISHESILEEGAAEYACILVISEHKDKYSNVLEKRIRKRSKRGKRWHYRVGFEKVEEYVKLRELDGLLEYLKKNSDIKKMEMVIKSGKYFE